MKAELDKLLCEKYPKIFTDRIRSLLNSNGEIENTAICWGFICGDGWFNIIDVLCSRIEEHLENNRRQIESNKKYFAEREMAINRDWSFLDDEIKRNEEWHKENPYWIENLKKEYLGYVPEWRSRVEPIPQVVAMQVKEKFGGLRFYYDGGDEYIDGLVSMAEGMSYRTCEVCGNPGELRVRTWIRALCDEHAKEQ